MCVTRRRVLAATMGVVPRTPCRVAHDFSGAITVIRGSADLARAKLDPNHPALVDVARIARSCEEVAALAMELRRMVCEPDGGRRAG